MRIQKKVRKTVAKININRNWNKEIDTIEYKESLGIRLFQGFLLIIDRRKWVSEILWFYGDTLDLLNVKLYVSNGS